MTVSVPVDQFREIIAAMRDNADLIAALEEMSDVEIRDAALSAYVTIVKEVAAIGQAVTKRCRLCEPGHLCAHCIAEGARLSALQEPLLVIAAVGQAIARRAESPPQPPRRRPRRS